MMCSVWGEPLSQTAQSFMPELLCGVNRSLQKVWRSCHTPVTFSMSYWEYMSHSKLQTWHQILTDCGQWLIASHGFCSYLLSRFCCSWLIYVWKTKQARMLLKSLVIIGTILGLSLGTVGTSVPWLFPNIFTPDQKIIQEVSFCLTASIWKINTASIVLHFIILNSISNLICHFFFRLNEFAASSNS